MRMALKSKNKLGFIIDKITEPMVKEGEDSAEANAWGIVNSMITSWIINVIEPKLHASVAYANSAHAMWENIRNGTQFLICQEYIN